MRLYVIRETDSRCRCLWSFHHLLIDGWSAARLLGELLETYTLLEHGQEPRFAPPGCYRDYIEWFRKQNLSDSIAYWSQRFEGYEAAASLPASESAIVSAPFEVVRNKLEPASSARVRNFRFPSLGDFEYCPANCLGTGAREMGRAWRCCLRRHHIGPQSGDPRCGTDCRTPGSTPFLCDWGSILPRPFQNWWRGSSAWQRSPQLHVMAPLHEITKAIGLPPGTLLFESILVLEGKIHPV